MILVIDIIHNETTMTPWQFHIGLKEKQSCMKKLRKLEKNEIIQVQVEPFSPQKDINSGTEVIASVPSIDKKQLSNNKPS